MFCPTCGAGEQRADAYCTRCGQWLTDANAAQGHWHPVMRRARTPEQRMRMMLIFNAMDAALALAAAILLFSTRAGRGADAQAHVFIAAAFCLVIAVHQAVSLLINLKIQQRLKRARTEKAAEAIAGGTYAGITPELNAGDSGLFTNARGGVTENTTELLDAVPRQPEQRQSR